jgi:hypothetical protein
MRNVDGARRRHRRCRDIADAISEACGRGRPLKRRDARAASDPEVEIAVEHEPLDLRPRAVQADRCRRGPRGPASYDVNNALEDDR